ncbi:MAG: cation:proton antiporter subunit C [Anaerolineales bacterium]|nr:cation:proton antiporter subunit C [Anaerolineales bacterium]
MLQPSILYALAAIALFCMGCYSLLTYSHLLRKILGVNVMGVGVFMLLIAKSYAGESQQSDPVPQALVLTGIVVAVCATALALNLAVQIEAATHRADLTDDEEEQNNAD